MAKILLVEDDLDLAQMVVEWLTFEHHSVELIGDGREGLERLRLCQYDVIVLDWGLPQLSGPESAKVIELKAVVRRSSCSPEKARFQKRRQGLILELMII